MDFIYSRLKEGQYQNPNFQHKANYFGPILRFSNIVSLSCARLGQRRNGMMPKSSTHSMQVIPFFIITLLTTGFSFLGIHPAYIFLLAICALPIAAVLLVVSYAELPYSWGKAKTAVSLCASQKTWITISASVVLTLSVLTTHWPLRLSYSLSKASLNRIAGKPTSGTKGFESQSSGIFSVVQTDVDDGLVCLWLDEDMGEPIGFVQGPSSKIKARFSNYDIIVLDDDWCLVNSL